MSLAPTVVVGDAPNAAPTSRRRLSFDIEATSLTILSQVPNQVSRGVLLLAFVFVFTLFFSIAELFAGLASQSLLLVEESVHMFADSVSFGISLWAEFKSETEHSERANLIGAGISLLTLTITMFAIGIESVRRIFHLHDHAVEVNSGTMLGFGLVLSCFHLFCLALYFCGGISVHSHEQHVNHDCASHNLVLANDKCDSSDEIVHSDECYDDHHELVCTHHHHHFHHEDNCASASEGLRISHIKAEKALGHGRKQNGEHSFTKVPLTSVHLTSNIYDKDTHEVDKEHVHPVHPEACSSHQGCAHGHSHGDGNIEPVSSSSKSSDDDLHGHSHGHNHNHGHSHGHGGSHSDSYSVSHGQGHGQNGSNGNSCYDHNHEDQHQDKHGSHGHSHGHSHDHEHGCDAHHHEECSHGHSHSCCGIDHTSLNMASAVFHIFIDFMHSFFVVVTALFIRAIGPTSPFAGIVDAVSSLIVAGIIGGGVFILAREFFARCKESSYFQAQLSSDKVENSASLKSSQEHPTMDSCRLQPMTIA